MLNSLDLVLLLITLFLFCYGIYRRVRLWKLGQPENRFDNTKERLRALWRNGILQVRTLRETLPGLMHLFIFWGFLIPFVLIIILNLRLNIYLPIWLAAPMSLLLDLCGLVALVGIVIAFYRRYIQKLEQLDRQTEDALALGFVFTIIFTGLIIEGLRFSLSPTEIGAWSPVGWVLGNFFQIFGGENVQALLHQIIRRIHLFVVLGFVAYLPYSKLLHIITSPLNIYFSSLKPKGELTTLDIENAEMFGVANIENFTWKQILDLDACTKCGRCQEVCPAHQSEKPLSPKNLIQELKTHWLVRGKELLAASGNGKAAEEFPESEIIDKVVSEDIIWACTTCRACIEECPVMIEHPQKLVDLRRYLVLMLSQFPKEVQLVFKNLNANSNPWGIGFSSRGEWADELGVNKFSGEDDSEILYFVGCAGSFDDRYKKVSTAMVRILNAAGVKFGILGAEEKCCGDSARRIGEEYLFQTLAQENIATFQQYNVKKILTTCPHGYNTLKHEYSAFDGKYEVIHAVELIADLLKQGRLPLKNSFNKSVVLHDSCYLGRYNDIYEQPREIMRNISGVSPVEMERNREKNFCCGAGGGRMWFEETQGRRINEMRVEQALKTKANTVGVSCPFCLTMFEDGIKDKGVQESVKAYDLIEMVAMALEE
ncbi:4Fe-4S dicluster domain-containing protein [candidate division KSB1 bacterium]|nr:4Fe-4S dicluster domain-containing protein [candidate division KSB1 bacterium]